MFSAQPGVPISSPFQFAHFPSNDSLRVITVLFTNEVWKMGERQGLSIAGSAGMHGSVSRRHGKHRSLFLGEAEHEWKVPWAGRWGRYVHHFHLPEGLPVQPQVVEAQRGAREKRWDPPALNKCLKTHGEWSLYFSPLDRHQGSSCRQWRCSGVPGACIIATRDSRQLLTDVYSEQPREAVEPLLEIWGQTDILRLDQEAEVCKTESEAS